MRLAQVSDGVVVNVIEVDPENIPDWAADWPEAETAGTGWMWDGEAFSEPAEPEASIEEQRAAMVCSPAQMRLALLSLGLLDQVQGIADSDPAASIVWEYATRIERLSPLVDALGGPNGFSPEQIDDIFRTAMEVQV